MNLSTKLNYLFIYLFLFLLKSPLQAFKHGLIPLEMEDLNMLSKHYLMELNRNEVANWLDHHTPIESISDLRITYSKINSILIKFNLFVLFLSFPLDVTQRITTPSGFFGPWFNTVAQWAVSQTGVQRFLAAKSQKQAQT